MTNRNRGRPTHVRTSELQTVLASDASASFKDEIAQLVQALAPHSTLDEATLREQQPVLLARVMALSPAGLDLVRVLRGETPEKARHSRQNVAASLRHVRKREGRSPLASDYPAGHVVPVLVWFYHGSFAAWPSVPMTMRHRPPGSLALRVLKDDLAHAHDPDPDQR